MPEVQTWSGKTITIKGGISVQINDLTGFASINSTEPGDTAAQVQAIEAIVGELFKSASADALGTVNGDFNLGVIVQRQKKDKIKIRHTFETQPARYLHEETN